MRRSMIASACAVALAASLSIAADGDVDTPDYLITDVAGDANGLNGQGFDEGLGDNSTPVDLAEGDVTGMRIASLYETADDGTTTITGVEFRTALSMEPAAGTTPLIHRLVGAANGCEFWVQSHTGGGAEGNASVRLFDAGCGLEVTGDETLAPSVTVRGDGINWSWDDLHGEMVVTIDFASADSRIVDAVAAGGRYAFEEIHVRVDTGVVTAPVVEEVFGRVRWTFGQDVPGSEAN